MILDVHSGSGSWFFTHPGSRGKKKAPESRIRILNTALFIRTHPGLSVPEAPVPEAETPAPEEEGGAPAGKVKRSLSLPRESSPPPLLPPKRVKSEQALSAGKNKAPGRRTFLCPAQSVNVICAAILGQSMGFRNRVGIGLSYRPASLHRLAESTPWNWFLGSFKV